MASGCLSSKRDCLCTAFVQRAACSLARVAARASDWRNRVIYVACMQNCFLVSCLKGVNV